MRLFTMGILVISVIATFLWAILFEELLLFEYLVFILIFDMRNLTFTVNVHKVNFVTRD